MKMKSNFRIFKVMKSTSKTIFRHYVLSGIFNDKFWRSHLDILYRSTQHSNAEHHEKKNLNNTLLLLLGTWPNNLMVLEYRSTLSYTVLDHACSQVILIAACESTILQGMTNNIRLTFSVGDTIPQFTIRIEQDNQNWWH